MDFSKFRGSGDLSDITVTIEDHEHKLHKFPFYARSDYFCELARSRHEGETEHVQLELTDFPGGNTTFEQVADFCYNMPIEINKSNVVALRCAAEYLKMFGPGNLTERTDKILASTVTSAKMVKSTSVVATLLSQSNGIGDIAQKAGVADILFDALVDSWRKATPLRSGDGGITMTANKSASGLHSTGLTSAFTRVSTGGVSSLIGNKSADRLDEMTIESILSLRADWMFTILNKARIAGISSASLGNLAVRYITRVLELDPNRIEHDADCDASTAPEESPQSMLPTTDPSNLEPEPNSSSKEQGGDQKASACEAKALDKEDAGYVLDKIVLSLPEQAFDIPLVTMDWLTKVLRIATAHGCSCRGQLVRVAGEMLSRLDPADLCVISPVVLHDIVSDSNQKQHQESGSGEETQKVSQVNGLHGDKACKLVDSYMSQMVAKGTLTSETFKLLSSATKIYPRPSHDSLFEVLLFVIRTEKDTLTNEAKEELTQHINFDLLSETSLQRALEDDILPVAKVAESSLRLCSRLRSELQSVKYIAEMQEEDIQKFQDSKIKGRIGSSRISGAAVGKTVTGSPSLMMEQSARLGERTPRMVDSGYEDYDLVEDGSADKSSLDHEDLRPDDLLSSTDPSHQHPYTHHSTSEHLRAAQGVLNAARHKLALPLYTGHRPARLTSPTSGSGLHHYTPRGGYEPDLSLEEELEFKFDRTFRSLDPRVRHQRLGGHSGHRTYFPYSNHTHRY